MLNSFLLLHDTLFNSKILTSIVVVTDKNSFLIIKKNIDEYIIYENIDSSILSLKNVLNIIYPLQIKIIKIMKLVKSKIVYPDTKIKRSNSI
jgi:hypothetical protein